MASVFTPGQGFQSVPDKPSGTFKPDVFKPKPSGGSSSGGSSGGSSRVSRERLAASIKADQEKAAKDAADKAKAEQMHQQELEAQKKAAEQQKILQQYKDVQVVQQFNAQNQITGMQIVDNQGKVLRNIKSREAVQYTPKTRFKQYEAPIQGYYDPFTGQEVKQSVTPEFAKQRGFIPIQVSAYDPNTGESIIRSETGLLTPEQMKVRQIIENNPNAAILYGADKNKMQSVELPRDFVVGGTPKPVPKPTKIDDIFASPKSSYEIAQRSKLYSNQEVLEMTKKTEVLMQVPMKFGGTKLVPVTPGYNGPTYTQVTYQDGSKRLYTPEGKEYYTPAYEGSKAQKIESAFGLPSKKALEGLDWAAQKAFTEVGISSKNLYVFLDKDGNVIKGRIPSRKEWALMQEQKWVKENYGALKEGKQKVFYNQKKLEDSYDYNFRRVSVRDVTGQNKITLSEYEELTGVKTPLSLLPRSYGDAALYGVGVSLPWKKAVAYYGSDVITKQLNNLYEKAGSPKTQLGMFGKASVASMLIASSPTAGAAYGFSFLKQGIRAPGATVQSLAQQAKERPGELAGFVVGGVLGRRLLETAEFKLRKGIKGENVNVPGYGEVVIVKIPKYGEVVWVKGIFSASEKLDIMQQINRLKGTKARIYTTVSPQGIPMQSFSNTKNVGFEVSQLKKPMRGLYEAPPVKFIEGYNPFVKGAAFSYYAQAGGRERLLPNPMDAIRSLLSKETFTRNRPFTSIRRTFKEVKTPKWVEMTAKSIEAGKGIPKQYSSIINKYYKQFLDKPIEFNGKTFVGLEKQKLLNSLNLKGTGSGVKLKVYSALLEYQHSNKVNLVGGAEVLAGVSPWGPEHQLVSSLGTRYFAKSRLDLRKGIKQGLGTKIIELVTGTKRGQYVARIDGALIEIQPVRQFPGKVKQTSKGKAKGSVFEDSLLTPSVVKDVFRRREVRPTTTAPRPFIIRDVVTTERVARREARRPEVVRNPLVTIRREARRTEARRPELVRRPEARRVEDRRDVIRPRIDRRPDVRRPDVRRPDPRVVRRRPTERPTRRQPNPFENIRPIQRQDRTDKKAPSKKPIKKPFAFQLTPTITQQIYRLRRKGGSIKRSTGFDILRV